MLTEKAMVTPKCEQCGKHIGKVSGCVVVFQEQGARTGGHVPPGVRHEPARQQATGELVR